jgi:UDP-3-O-[3-hydroxymyristoyl] glucosamine N-acyltransferase LpxD
MIITSKEVAEILTIEIKRDFQFNIGLSNSTLGETLTFCDDAKYVAEINNNPNIEGVITTEIFSSNFSNKKLVIQDSDPRYAFYTLLNTVGKRKYLKIPTQIHESAIIHPTAFVSEYNVCIGEQTVIGPNVSVLPDVEIGHNCIIQPNSVIGSEGFEYKRTSKGILPVFHDGKVIIKNNVEIGSNTCVDKGFSFRYTIIENDVKIDNLVHVAHGVQIEAGAFIIAGTILGGSTTIGKNAWLSINVSIAPGLRIGCNSFVSIGAVVTKNVADGEQVTGNFAIPHEKFLKLFKSNLQSLAK